MDFAIGLSVGITVTMVIAGRIIHRANATLRRLHHECGMAAEGIKYSDYLTFEHLKGAMSYAEKRHGGLRFVEKYILNDRFKH